VAFSPDGKTLAGVLASGVDVWTVPAVNLEPQVVEDKSLQGSRLGDVGSRSHPHRASASAIGSSSLHWWCYPSLIPAAVWWELLNRKAGLL
jgi:hypothetical protein